MAGFVIFQFHGLEMSIEDDHDDYHHPGDQNGTPEHVGHVHLPCISDNGFSGFFGLVEKPSLEGLSEPDSHQTVRKKKTVIS